MFDQSVEVMQRVRRERPLVVNIMNNVAMDFVANGLLCVGASPVMSQAWQELEDLMQHAKAVVINVGTLSDKFVRLCQQACEVANRLNKPIILDPVGAGASRYRTETCLMLLKQYDVAIVRGNASEVMALAGVQSQSKGVDSAEHSDAAIESARTVSKAYHATVVVSGKVDVIVEGDHVSQFDRGSALMPFITGTGCLLSAVIGAVHGVESDRYMAAQIATVYYGICGEMAAEKAVRPGSFRTEFLNALHDMPERGRYEESQ